VLEDVVKRLSEVALAKHLTTVKTTAGFICLLTEQLGDVAKRYWHYGREAKELPTDVTDIIVQCVSMLNWLGYSSAQISEAMEESIDKLERALHGK